MTTEKLEVAIWQIAGHIASFVETGSQDSTERMGHKTLSGEFRMIDIPPSETNSTNEQFTRHPKRYGLLMGIDEVHFIPIDPGPDGCASIRLRRCVEGKQRGTDGGLGWSIAVHDMYLLRKITQPLQCALLDRLNTYQETHKRH